MPYLFPMWKNQREVRAQIVMEEMGSEYSCKGKQRGSGDDVRWIVSVQIAQNHEGVVSMMFASYPGAAPSEMSPHVIFESILATRGAHQENQRKT